MNEEWSALPYSKIHMKGMKELENECWAAITITNDSCKNHRWMLKLVGENLLENRIFT